MKNRKSRITTIVLILILFISIGYAVLTTVFNINSNVSLSKVSFNIHFDNIVVASDHKAEVTDGNDARITNDAKTEITFTVNLKKLGDYYSFTTDIVNEGSIPGKVKSVELNGLTDSQKKLLKYNIYYTDNSKDITPGDYIGPESTKNITVDLVYDLNDEISNEDMPTDDLTVQCTLVINMENGKLSEYRARAASNRLMQNEDYFPTSMLHFDRPTSADEHQGVYRLDGTENDDYPIYFYRGGNAEVHNHVVFANMCWRIIRTTNTGGIKIIYNGTPTADGRCIDSGNGTQLGDHKYSTTSWEWTDSLMKDYLSTWYFENIVRYQTYLEDTPFCNDNKYENGRVSLECDPEHEIKVSNGKNNYPIGLITAEEADLCGLSTTASSYPWLYTSKEYFTMTGNATQSYYLWRVTGAGALHNVNTVDFFTVNNAIGVRPVISFNSDVSFNEGDGTADNPYIASLS